MFHDHLCDATLILTRTSTGSFVIFSSSVEGLTFWPFKGKLFKLASVILRTNNSVCFFLIKSAEALISQMCFIKKLYIFRAVPLPIIRSFPLYLRRWYMSCSFDDSFQARAGWNYSSILAVLENCTLENS